MKSSRLSDTRHICHYTNFCVLKSIIENHCFWAFSTISPKDKDEVRYGINYIIKNIEDLPSIRKHLEEHIANKKWDNYIICFSLKRNKKRMWKNYTKDLETGISFVFDEAKLLASFKEKILSYEINQKFKLYTPEFLQCQYSDDEGYLSAYFERKIGEWNQKYGQLSEINIGIMFEELLGIAYAIKHKKYAYEGEKRIILPPTVTHFLPEKEFNGKKYVEFPFDIELFLDAIEAIDISPMASLQCKSQVEKFLTQYKKSLTEKITQC